jgi:organic hydroperoxide reductase OsmC/OhrA
MAHPFPHRYRVGATAAPAGDVVLNSPELPPLPTSTPAEFDGPGDRWSPETLFVAAVADCYLLTFRGIAAKSKLPWLTVACDVTGTLDRIDGITRFTDVAIQARLEISDPSHEALARRILQKAEATCLITRSLTASAHLDATVTVAAPVLKS